MGMIKNSMHWTPSHLESQANGVSYLPRSSIGLGPEKFVQIVHQLLYYFLVQTGANDEKLWSTIPATT